MAMLRISRCAPERSSFSFLLVSHDLYGMELSRGGFEVIQPHPQAIVPETQSGDVMSSGTKGFRRSSR